MLFRIARILPFTRALYSAELMDPKGIVSAKAAISIPFTVREEPAPPFPWARSYPPSKFRIAWCGDSGGGMEGGVTSC
jgi:hypothetical protein